MKTLVESYLAAVKVLESTGPRPINDVAALLSNGAFTVGDKELRAHLIASDPNDSLRRALGLQLATFDHTSSDASWALETAPNTLERRDVVLRLLGVDEATATLMRDLFPVANLDEPIIIADEWDPWYTPQIKRDRSFYWAHYTQYLHEYSNWKPAAIAALDKATDCVVERLAPPTAPSVYQSKGLAVGYVQSGKTANFTGVIAKAVDAGYRLIIVLTGTTDLLRTQTQRRLDMELVGQENILRGIKPDDNVAREKTDYVLDDPDWGSFVQHGLRPADAGNSDIHRLTKKSFDYKSLGQGISALDFPKRERHLPFYDPINLFIGDSRLAVVKKNSAVLKKLVEDLNKITTRLEEVPTLIIDDESDQASVNTSNPKRWKGSKERTAINRHIAELLDMLPRAQYVGYTATPFANVFIDPNDAKDIFPKNFLIALPRAPGYMGASDFHDLESDIPISERTMENSAEKAHFRLVSEDDDSQTAYLQEALDAFILTGAVKLYREAQGHPSYRHHTMLYHVAMKREAHREQARVVNELWNRAGYRSSACYGRLLKLYENDILRVSRAHQQDGSPENFQDLIPFIGETVSKVGQTGNPVLIINSDKIEGEELDFARTPHVWRILVGGNKLARGFTVEGLTISYYMRETKQADTMMQMGRWFGFRDGFRDLVRLYTTSRLYDAFEAISQDEEFFRDELRQYAPLDDNGRPQVTPEQIPPLVAQHLGRINPTAANKMYNARPDQRRTLVKEPSSAYPEVSKKPQIAANTAQFSHLISSALANPEVVDRDGSSVSIFSMVISNAELVEILSALNWSNEESFRPDLNFLRKAPSDKISDWYVVLPQLKGLDSQVTIEGLEGAGPLSVHRRRVLDSGKIQGKRDPADRALVLPTANKHGSTRGGMLLYPVVDKELVLSSSHVVAGDVVIAFALFLPDASGAKDGKLITWTTRDSSLPAYALMPI